MRLTRFRVAAAGAVALTLALAACGEPPDLSSPVVNDGAVTIADDAFAPAAIEVPIGTTVRWTWSDGEEHDVTFDDGTSGVRSSGTYDRTFDVPGDFTYRCSLHGDMLGRIVVTGGKE